MLCCEIVFTTGVKIYCYGGVLLLCTSLYTYVHKIDILHLKYIKQTSIYGVTSTYKETSRDTNQIPLNKSFHTCNSKKNLHM